MQHQDTPEYNRRDFVKLGALAGIGAAIGGMAMNAQADEHGQTPPPPHPFAAPPMERVRIGFVGAGGMGTGHIRNLLRIPGVELVAVCDIVEGHAKNAQDLAVKAGQKEPKLFCNGERDFERMCETEELDLVYTATPWEWHVPVCVAALKNGKHAATEVPAAVTLEECWQLVESAEKYKKHCVMQENCCYGRTELLTLNLVRKGLLGELVYGAGGYMHDLRDVKFGKEGEGLWRRAHAMKRDGNLYPTHGLGPVAQCLNINRGDRFEYLISMSSPSRGLQAFAAEHLDKDDPRLKETYVCGDVNASLIKTANGLAVTVMHDTNLPRPYTRINMVQGTKGIVEGYPDRVYIDGRSPKHEYEPVEKYYEEFDHPLFKRHNEDAKTAGHGGMDYIEDYRLIECLLKGQPTDLDVYDAAMLSAVSALSEASVANKGKPVDYPDFTRGQWKTNTPIGIITGEA
jgi:predicted dehydrogenase